MSVALDVIEQGIVPPRRGLHCSDDENVRQGYARRLIAKMVLALELIGHHRPVKALELAA